MMRNKAFLLVSLVILNLMIETSLAVVFEAYSDELDKCLFTYWKDTAKVLSKVPECKGKQKPLCYSPNGKDQAMFISCYNTDTKIPVYTAHTVESNRVGGRKDAWHNDKGKYAPQYNKDVAKSEASSVKKPDNYKKTSQSGLGVYQNYDGDNDQFLAKGHLVPCADIKGGIDNRKLTFVNTNVAPQWQLFNGGNWAWLEQAIRDYVDDKSANTVYVFTGTDGELKKTGSLAADTMKLYGITVPQYFWMAVCVPDVGSYLFWAENNVGTKKTDTSKQRGCGGLMQTKSLGIVECLAEFDKSSGSSPTNKFMLPPFTKAKCKTNTAANFLNTFLKLK